MNELLVPVVRRAILDYLDEQGGEHNHDVLAMMLNARGHRIARLDVIAQLRWLAEAKLIHCEEIGPFHVARILADGRDVAAGNLRLDGIHRHKTGE